jgi:hypothetical protein
VRDGKSATPIEAFSITRFSSGLGAAATGPDLFTTAETQESQ